MKALKIAIAGVLVTAALLWVFGIPANFLVNLVQDRVETASGYRLHVDGGATIGFWPAPTVSLRNVTLDRAGVPAQDQFRAETIRIALALADLTRGHTHITELMILRPILRVPLARERVVAAAVSGSPAAAPATAGGAGAKATSAAADSDGTKSAMAIDRIRIEEGTVALYSEPDRLEKNIEHINLDLSRGAAGGRPNVTGRLDWGGQTFQVELKSDVLPQQLEGQTIPVEVTLQAPGRWRHPLSMKAELSSRKNSLVINSLSGRFGQNRFDGFATVDFSTNKPVVKADLDFNRLPMPQAPDGERVPPRNAAAEPESSHDKAPRNVANLPRSDDAPPPQNAATRPQSDADNAPHNVMNQPRSDGEDARPQNVLGKPWSGRELHFDALNFFDAEVRVSAAELALGSLRVAPVTVETTVNKGVLQARLENAGLYGGEANGVISLDAAASTPAQAMQLHLAGVNALPLLSDVAGFESLAGTMRADIDVNATGRSQKVMISSLAGSVDVELSNGAVRGIDVAKLVHNLTRTILEGWQQNATDRTPLTRFNAHFSLANGVATTDNLDLSGPVVRMTGAGSVDLAAKTLQLKVDPQLVTGRQAAGGSADTAGLGVPAIIAGSWSKPRIYPDVAGILNNPESVYNQLKAAGKGLFGDSGSGNAGKLGTILKGLGNMLGAPAANRNGDRGDDQ